MQNFPIQILKEWFNIHKRALPWRDDPTPYRVWISEIMLQQTQVSVVIPYFERWMRNFPSIESLAAAPLESVLKCWEGLGYYSRARHLHQAARYILEHHAGIFPSTAEEISQIKGVGLYTQGAIRSFAFRQKAAAVDGNVLRVLSRFLGYEDDIDSQKSKHFLQGYAEHILPDDQPWLISEGLIELGATICMKKPKCEECPLMKHCIAFRDHLQTVLPNKRKRPPTISLKRIVAVVVCKKHVLLQKREKGKVMADLYEFPYWEWNAHQDIAKTFEESLHIPLTYLKPLLPKRHSFTRYRAELFPHLLETRELSDRHHWVSVEKLDHLPFSSGHKKILLDL